MSLASLHYYPPRYEWASIVLLFLIILGSLSRVMAIETTITCPKENILLAGENGSLIVTEKHEGIVVGSERKCRLHASVFQMPLPLLSQFMMTADDIYKRIDWYKSEFLKKLVGTQKNL